MHPWQAKRGVKYAPLLYIESGCIGWRGTILVVLYKTIKIYHSDFIIYNLITFALGDLSTDRHSLEVKLLRLWLKRSARAKSKFSTA